MNKYTNRNLHKYMKQTKKVRRPSKPGIQNDLLENYYFFKYSSILLNPDNHQAINVRGLTRDRVMFLRDPLVQNVNYGQLER